MIRSSQLKTSQLASYLIWQLGSQGRFVTLPWEIPQKTKLHPWNSTKSNCVIPLGSSKAKNQDPKKVHMIFFLIIPGNSTPFLIDLMEFQPTPPPTCPRTPIFGFVPEYPRSVVSKLAIQLASRCSWLLTLELSFSQLTGLQDISVPETIAHKVIQYSLPPVVTGKHISKICLQSVTKIVRLAPPPAPLFNVICTNLLLILLSIDVNMNRGNCCSFFILFNEQNKNHLTIQTHHSTLKLLFLIY